MGWTRARKMAEQIAATKGVKANQSPVFRYMLAHHAELAATVGDWPAFARARTADGMLTANGKPLSAQYCRQTWFKVNRLAPKLAEKADAVAAAKIAEREARARKVAADLAETQAGARAAKIADDKRRRIEFYGTKPSRLWLYDQRGQNQSTMKLVATGPAPWAEPEPSTAGTSRGLTEAQRTAAELWLDGQDPEQTAVYLIPL